MEEETGSRVVTIVVLENGAVKSPPVRYNFKGAKNPEGKDNVFIVLEQEVEKTGMYIAISNQDVSTFAKMLNDAIAGSATPRDKIVDTIANNVSLIFPRTGDVESMSWICFPSSFEKNPDGDVIISFEWIYYGEERESVMKEINDLAKSDYIVGLIDSLKEMDKKTRESGSLKEKRDGIALIAQQFGFESLESRDPVELVKAFKHYKDFGGQYIMKEIMTDAKIAIIVGNGAAMAIADDLNNVG
jgi:hypothetical protein